MKIGITGDTHGREQVIRKIVQETPLVEMWLHTGDYSQDAYLLESLSGLPVIKVAGNCDGIGSKANPDEIFPLEGFNIWLTHGHRYFHHQEVGELAWWANKLEADIVVFGHTHVPLAKWYGDKLLLNPGSPVQPRGGSEPSFAILTLQQGCRPQVEFIRLQVDTERLLFDF